VKLINNKNNNKMKKLIYLFLTVLIVSCSSDDSIDPSNDPLLGEWDSYRSEEFNENSCSVGTQSYSFNFLADGTFTSDDWSQGLCTGTWENLGNNQFNYRLSFNCDSEVANFEIIFYCNNNVMRETDEYTVGAVYGYMAKEDYNPDNCNEVEYFCD